MPGNKAYSPALPSLKDGVCSGSEQRRAAERRGVSRTAGPRTVPQAARIAMLSPGVRLLAGAARLQQLNQNWFDRMKSEVTLASEFAAKLTGVHSIPETANIFQEWASRRMEMAAEDTKRLVADSQKFMETRARLLSKSWLSSGSAGST